MSEAPLNWIDKIEDTIQVRVRAKAAKNQIQPEVQNDGTLLLRVYVTVGAIDNKANQAVIKLLAKALKLPKSSLTIIHGQRCRDKIIRIEK